MDMAAFGESRSLAAETEPLALLTEGAAGIAVIVLAIIGLAGSHAELLAAIATIVIGVGLMVQGFNTVAEYSRVATGGATVGQTGAEAPGIDLGGDVMVAVAAGITGIVLGILGLLGIHTTYLIPAAVIVFGADLLLAGALGLARGPVAVAAQPGGPAAAKFAGAPGASGLEIMIGVAALILGILSVVFAGSAAAVAGVLALVALIAIGAAMLVVSASFSSGVMHLFLAAA
jgi:hypothetical protein